MRVGRNSQKGLLFPEQILPTQIAARCSKSHSCNRSRDAEMCLRRFSQAPTLSRTETHIVKRSPKTARSFCSLSPIKGARLRRDDSEGGLKAKPRHFRYSLSTNACDSGT